MAAVVGEYIQRTWDRPWSWGTVDCTIWVADWCLEHWGVDPASRWRGVYDSEDGAAAIIGNGLFEFVSRDSGIPVRTEAREGDVAVIEIASHQIAAIRFGEKWAFRKPNGVGIVRAEPLMIWGY